jgi:DNA-binding helix-hairpin-helix protein with protein kinase domain
MLGVSHTLQSKGIRPVRGIFYTSQSDMVRLGRRIGTGAEGEVYEIRGRSDLVAKVYHEPPPPEKAEKLVILSRLSNERLFNLSAWPVSTLRNAPEGEVTGFVMKKVREAEEVHTLHSPKSRLQKFPGASWAFLIYVAANIARAVATIHEHGLVIGDVNPKNILVTRKATVYLLDVDSFQLWFDGKTYRCEGGFPEYTPPELQGVSFRNIDRAQEHDGFGLAVAIFQLLFMGRHPFSGRYLGAGEMPLERAIRESRFAYGDDAEVRKMRQPPGALALDAAPPSLVDLFRRAFLSTDRPHPREWIETLSELTKALKRCELHSGHYYYRELRDCPWCGIEKQACVRLFNFLLSGAESRRGPFLLDEVWHEIVSVKTPETQLLPWDTTLEAHEPSAEVVIAVGERKGRLSAAILLSAIIGFGYGLFGDIQLLFLGADLSLSDMLFFAVIVTSFFIMVATAWMVCGAEQIELNDLQTIFQSQQPVPDDPLVRKIQSRRMQAESTWREIQEQYELETGNKRWGVKYDELHRCKEAYENLAQSSDLKFNECRLHLERELSGGALCLRRIKHQTEINSRKLQLALMEACREWAQAEKDWQEVIKRNSFKPVLWALLIAFFIGMMMNPDHGSGCLNASITIDVHEASGQ